MRSTTDRPEVLGDVGGFGGLFAIDRTRWRDPVLVAGTDTAGTKMLLAIETGRLDTIGIDVVAMCVDDIAVQGAEPLFFLDCISTSELVPEQMRAVVAGVAEGCRQAGCALLGGEMAEVRGLLVPGHLDVAGFAVGVVEREAILPAAVTPGDAIIGIASPGLRSNGYALARRALLDVAGRTLADPAWPGAPHSLADELLRPSVIYARVLLSLRSVADVHAFAHVTGGGIAGNLVRVLPSDCAAVVRRVWDVPRIFTEIQRAGRVSDQEMARVFNLGIGMLVVLPVRDAPAALARLREGGHDAWEVGGIVAGARSVSIVTPDTPDT